MTCLDINKITTQRLVQSAESVEYIDCISSEDLLPTSVPDMILNNLMVRFHCCWSFGECGVLLHCHRSQVQFGPEC